MTKRAQSGAEAEQKKGAGRGEVFMYDHSHAAHVGILSPIIDRIELLKCYYQPPALLQFLYSTVPLLMNW